MKTAHFEFDASLMDLLPRVRRMPNLVYHFSGPQSAKHLIESLGIPHTEIGDVTCDGRRVGLDYLVRDGDMIEVGSVSPSVDVPDEPRFVLDGHLGRLSAGLRMLGLDSLYRGNFGDQELAEISVTEGRILLTRDRRLLMRRSIMHGYLVRSLDARQQLAEVTTRFGLARWMRPFRRCIRCNQLLEPVPKEDVLDQLQPLTQRYYDDFHICPACRQVYWNGSHVGRMRQVIANLRSGGAP